MVVIVETWPVKRCARQAEVQMQEMITQPDKALVHERRCWRMKVLHDTDALGLSSELTIALNLAALDLGLGTAFTVRPVGKHLEIVVET